MVELQYVAVWSCIPTGKSVDYHIRYSVKLVAGCARLSVLVGVGSGCLVGPAGGLLLIIYPGSVWRAQSQVGSRCQGETGCKYAYVYIDK